MSFYKPKPDAIEKYSKDLDSLLQGNDHSEDKKFDNTNFYNGFDIENPVEFVVPADIMTAPSKRLYNHKEGLTRLTNDKFSNYLPISLQMRIINDFYNKKLPESLIETAKDMIMLDGEWASELFQVVGDELLIYPDISNMRWRNSSKVYNIVNYSLIPHKRFELSKGNQKIELDSSQPIAKVAQINPELIKALYGAPFENLMPDTKKHATICLPSKGILPIIRCNRNYQSIFSSRGNAASRGYRFK